MKSSEDFSLESALKLARMAAEKGNRTAVRRWAMLALRIDSESTEAWLMLSQISSPEARKYYLSKALAGAAKNSGNKITSSGKQTAAPPFSDPSPQIGNNKVVSMPVENKPWIPGWVWATLGIICLPIIAAMTALVVTGASSSEGWLSSFSQPTAMVKFTAAPIVFRTPIPTETTGPTEEATQTATNISSNLVQSPRKKTGAPAVPLKTKTAAPYVISTATPDFTATIPPVVLWTNAPPFYVLTPNTRTPAPEWKIPTPPLDEENQYPTEMVYMGPSPTPVNTVTPRPGEPGTLPVDNFIPGDIPLMGNATISPEKPNPPGYTPAVTATISVNPNPKPPDDRYLVVDLSEQKLSAYDRKGLVKAFSVSTGLSATPTLTGDFFIYDKTPATDMSGPGYYLPGVPWVMFFYKDYAIHGTFWHSNFGNPMSHGCVNLSPTDAEWLYNFSSVGTPVHVQE